MRILHHGDEVPEIGGYVSKVTVHLRKVRSYLRKVVIHVPIVETRVDKVHSNV